MIRTEIYINNALVDLIDDVAMPLTYAIADIKEPQKRNTNFSKTITIPGTQNNNKLFGNLWNINATVNSSGSTNYNPSFNPNYKASVLVTVDNLEQFRGIVQLTKIRVTDDYTFEYDIFLQGKLSNIFQVLDTKFMNQIDLSAYNHPYTESVQQASWANYIYHNGSTQPYTLGSGYVYPMIDYGYNNGVTWDVRHFFPAVFEKTIVDRMFAQAGFQYQSNFFNSDFFKHLVIPYCGGSTLKLTNAEIKSRTFRASSTGTTSIHNDGHAFDSIDPIHFDDDFTLPNYDTGNNFSTSTYKFTAAKTGTYDISFSPLVDITHHLSTGTFTPGGGFLYTLGFFIVDKVDITGNVQNICSRQFQAVTFNVGGGQFYINLPTTITNGATSSQVTGLLSATASLTAGDKVRCYYTNKQNVNGSGFSNMYGDIQSGSYPYYTAVNIKQGSYFAVQISDTNIHEGDTVDITNILPATIKQSDYFNSLIKDFNLYVTQDPVIENKLIIEPRNDFYSSGTIRDWSMKLDYSQPFEITPMGDLNTRTFIYSYKQDGDYFNELYNKKFKEVYGQQKTTIGNDFLKDTILQESIFSATPLADNAGYDRVLSKIYILNDQGQVTPKPSNIRRLYYGGVKSTANTWNYQASSGTTGYSTYPYAGHLDDVASPTIDLSFGMPREVFYTASSYTDNNLYNIYHKQMIDEISDPDSKIFTGMFKLTPLDIALLDFRDDFFFHNEYWRLNKIYDYDATSNNLIKCEFVRLKQHATFVASNGTTNGGNDFQLGNLLGPTYNGKQSSNNSHGAFSIGQNNIIDPTAIGCFVTGIGNTIGAGVTNSNILGSSGCTIMAGLTNVSLINSNGVVANQSNMHYINNVLTAQWSPLYSSMLKITASGGMGFNLTMDSTHGTIICDCSLNTVDCTLPNPSTVTTYDAEGMGMSKIFMFIKIDSSGNAVTINPYGLETINGASFKTLTTQYQKFGLQTDGTNWYIVT